ncbi:MAG: hypothetical protein AB7O24_19000 [Kofleriaceae bacterium]
MVQRFAPNVGKTGLFLPTKSLQPIGAEIKFELRLADDTPVLVGLGRVKVAKPPDPANPRAAFGMAVELMRVTRESRDLILRMLERRKQLGLAETGLPMPSDIDAARRIDLIDTGVRDAVSAGVPSHILQPEPSSEPLLTEPRRPSSPGNVAPPAALSALDPEPPRRKRARLSELIERASGAVEAVAAAPELEDDVDVAAAIARARSLAGSDLDAELEALRDSSAAPIEVNVDAASAELARRLGGAEVSRSARWAPPPATISTPPPIAAPREPQYEPPEPVDDALVDESANAAPPYASSDTAPLTEPVALLEPEPAPAFDSGPTTKSPEAIAQPEQSASASASGRFNHLLADDPEPAEQVHFAPEPALDREVERDPDPDPDHALADALRSDPDPDPQSDSDPELVDASHSDPDPHRSSHYQSQPSIEVDPDQIAEETNLFDEVERTQLGNSPLDVASFDSAALAHQLDNELSEAERDDLGLSGPIAGAPQASYEDRGDSAGGVDDDDDDGDEASITEDVDPVRAAPLAEDLDEIEEIDDFEILDDDDDEIEADAVDPVTPPGRDSMSDFAMRLDLGDSDPDLRIGPPDSEVFKARHIGFDDSDAEIGGISDALAALEAGDEPPSQERSRFDDPLSFVSEPAEDDSGDSRGFTLAEPVTSQVIDFDSPHAGLSPAHEFDDSDVIPPNRTGRGRLNTAPPLDPRSLRRHHTQAPQHVDDESLDLEAALDALDVDLDDLSVPSELPKPARSTTAQRLHRASNDPSRKNIPRAPTDDGVVIDFDDDDE